METRSTFPTDKLPMSLLAQARSLSLTDYASELAEAGTQVLGRTEADFWIRYESWALMRIPTFATGRASPGCSLQAAVAGAGLRGKLPTGAGSDSPRQRVAVRVHGSRLFSRKAGAGCRRNVRRGSRELRIEPVTTDRLLATGFQAFNDTRGRVGVSDGTREVFNQRFASRGKCRGHVFLGAWHGQELVAFLSITEVDDWAEIEGCFSSNAALGMRPNDTLMIAALTDYLAVRRCRLVSYGLSSIQAVSTAAGLHEFKTKVGFQAKPVHRAFVTHPLFRPLVNGVTQRCVSALLTLAPSNRLLKKCDGMLLTMLGKRTLVGA